MAAVLKNNLYGFINISGEVVIPFEFLNAWGFADGLTPAANVKGFWGYIDKKGTKIIKPSYDFIDSFENGEARVIKGEKVFYIDRQNNIVHN